VLTTIAADALDQALTPVTVMGEALALTLSPPQSAV